MLTQSNLRKKHIYTVCEKSGDILQGAVFKGVRLADRDTSVSVPPDATIVCCGKLSEDEMLFRTEDGRYYFSLCDGWGEEDGVLYGLSQGMCFDFKHPTAAENILAECDAALGTYCTWGGAMAYQYRKHVLDAIRSVTE